MQEEERGLWICGESGFSGAAKGAFSDAGSQGDGTGLCDFPRRSRAVPVLHRSSTGLAVAEHPPQFVAVADAGGEQALERELR